jgi:hypothetical protein
MNKESWLGAVIQDQLCSRSEPFRRENSLVLWPSGERRRSRIREIVWRKQSVVLTFYAVNVT